ncbi:MAG: peptide-methionine (R)-S-oxide reductase MsrB [Candidatus Poseidoniaceae archaeon]|nr:peptide-methionine (R)-S-oxide reductase MsrB [Candidatus Poseidoniaceae archaeon]
MSKRAVMALSGGMDSTSVLLRLLADGCKVSCVSYLYGQKHSIELDRATKNIAYLQSKGHDVDHEIVDLSSAMNLFESALLEGGSEVPEGHYEEEQMKATVVPNRNAIFASILYGYALSVSIREGTKVSIALGVHSGDHEIYPDCRPEFYTALEHAFMIGNWDSDKVGFTLPYLDGDKTSILKDALNAADSLGLNFDRIFENTITSYNPDSDGRSSGRSGSDVERILAFHALDLVDPIEYVEPWTVVLEAALATERAHKDAYYKEKLSELQYQVSRLSGTEQAFTGMYWDEKRKGRYTCVCCDHLLFSSKMKFDSGCGWPSFHSEDRRAAIDHIEDRTYGMVRTEVRCSKCDAHLGHVFEDGPREHGGQRYCINSASINFEEMEE